MLAGKVRRELRRNSYCSWNSTVIGHSSVQTIVARPVCILVDIIQSVQAKMTGFQDDVVILKSLIAIHKEGLPLGKVEWEYINETGSPLEYRKYGYRSLCEMLEAAPGIVLSQSTAGVVCRVNDQKMSHVTSLIARTKTRSGSRPKSRFHCNFKSRSSYQSSRGFSSSPKPLRFGCQKEHSISLRSDLYNKPSSAFTHSRSTAQYSNSPRSSIRNVPSIVQRPPSYNDHSGASFSKTNKPANQGSHSPNLHYRAHNNAFALQSIGSSTASCSRPVLKEEESKLSSGHSISAAYVSGHCIKSSESDWSSDSSNDKQGVIEKLSKSSSTGSWPSSSSEKQKLELSDTRRNVRIVENVINGAKPSERAHQEVHVASLRVVSQNIKGQLKNKVDSDSDWSSDVEVTPSEGDCKRIVIASSAHSSPPLQNTTVSSSQPLVNQKGRGKFCALSEILKLGAEKSLSCSSRQGTAVGGRTPCTRETLYVLKDGLPSIVVKVPNGFGGNSVLAQKASTWSEPSFEDFQFVGDSFLLRVAEVSFGCRPVRFGSSSICGLCRSNLTISKCEEDIVGSGISEKIVLMIGMTDILEGATIEEMKSSMSSLLHHLKNVYVVLLTLPVLPSFILAGNESKLRVLELFNKWLLQLPLPCILEIDLYLYSDAPFYMRVPGSAVETFSKQGSRIVGDEIISAIHRSRF